MKAGFNGVGNEKVGTLHRGILDHWPPGLATEHWQATVDLLPREVCDCVCKVDRVLAHKGPVNKPIVVFLLVLTAFASRAALPQPDLVAQVYFAGSEKILAAPNAKHFENEFCGTNALALRRQTGNKLAPWLAAWLPSVTGAGSPNGAAQLRPLLDDLQTAEWLAEARASGNDPVDLALAIRLSNDRAQAWVAALKPFFPAGTFAMSGGWLIFDSGTGLQKLGNDVAQKAMARHDEWFSLDINWPRLGQWFPGAGQLGLPETQFKVTAPDDFFRVNGTFFYPQPLSLNPAPWQFPSNLVHCPFNSFTAARGFGSWLGTQSWAQPYLIQPVPNQFYSWALPGVPYQWYFAAPVPNGPAAVDQLYNRWQPQLLAQAATGQSQYAFSLDKADNKVRLEGIPIIKPIVAGIHGRYGDFLYGGGFENNPRTLPVPPELYQRLATPNLVYYHWEITRDREPAFLQCMQLTMAVTRHTELDASTAGYKWFASVTPTLLNTDTEVTQSGPDQLTFARKAPGIFTCLEFYFFASWLEARNFPGCNLNSPPLPERVQTQLRARRTGIIMPPMGH